MGTAGKEPVVEPVVSAKTNKDSKAAAPLYKRLPRGPHRMDRDEVAFNQRARCHGAMLEAVGEFGYEATTIARLISLSGISRRTFYEQFSGKEECLLETFDEVVRHGAKQVRSAWGACDGNPEDKARAVFRRFVEATEKDSKAALLTFVEVQAVGAPGALRMCRASTTYEPMLVELFGESETGPLPIPVVRGIIGGLHGAVSGILREGRLGEDRDLAEDMLRWTMTFWASATAEMTEEMAARLTAQTQELSSATADKSDTRQLGRDDRERLLHSLLRLATLRDYRDITTPDIAEDAGLPLETFDEIFAYKDECYLAAVEMVGEEILEIVDDSALGSADWPSAVRRVVKQLMCHLAARPVYAQTIAQEAFSASTRTRKLALGVIQQIATLLTKDAPSQPQSELAVEAIAGAILHTVRYQVAVGRIHLLAALADDLTYMVLASFIGVNAAFESIREY